MGTVISSYISVISRNFHVIQRIPFYDCLTMSYSNGTSLVPGLPLYDVPGKPSKAVVSLTNLQSDKPAGSCVTDSIYLDWVRPATDGGRPVLGYTVEMYDLPTGASR